MLAYWDPFVEMSRIQDRFFGKPSAEREYTFRPAVDIFEDAEGVQVKADLAGVKPEDIKVEVENNEQRDGYHRVERFHGTFSRSFSLTDDVNSEAIEAKYENGVLTVRLAKRPAAKRREIAVKAAA